MKYNQTWKKGYAETVEYAVASALDAVGRGGHFTLREFADGFDFKITWNLRRRIRELVDAGKLSCAQRYLNNGRLGYVYSAPEQSLAPDAGEHPLREMSDWLIEAYVQDDAQAVLEDDTSDAIPW